MSSRLFTPESARTSDSCAGFTLVELLVALLLSSLALGVMTHQFATVARSRGDMEIVMEAQQGLQSAIATITQEVRQAGACLPQTGTFISMDGEDQGTTDVLTFRTGRVDPDTLTCVRAVLTEEAEAGDSTITVDDNSGFETDDLVYVTDSSGDAEAFLVTGLIGSTKLRLSGGLSGDVPVGGGVYATEARTYATSSTADGLPVMTVTIDEEDPHVLAQGVVELDVEYRLAPCPPCDPVSIPATNAEWHKVREISFTVTVQSRRQTREGEYVYLTGGSTIKPRNFL